MTRIDSLARPNPNRAQRGRRPHSPDQDSYAIRAALVHALNKLDGISAPTTASPRPTLPAWRATKTAAWQAATQIECAEAPFVAAILEPMRALVAFIKVSEIANVAKECGHVITDMQVVHTALARHDMVAYGFAVRLDAMSPATALNIHSDPLMHDLAMVVKQVDPVRTLIQLDQLIGALRTLCARMSNRCARQPRNDLDPFLVGFLILAVGFAGGVLAVEAMTRSEPGIHLGHPSRVVTSAVAAAIAPGAVVHTNLVSAIGSFWGLVPAAAARAAASKAADAAALEAHRAASATVVAMAQVAAMAAAVLAALAATVGAFGTGRMLEQRIKQHLDVLEKAHGIERGLLACREKVQGAARDMAVVIRGVLAVRPEAATEE